MKIESIQKDGKTIANIYSETPVINSVQSALDLMMTVQYRSDGNQQRSFQ